MNSYIIDLIVEGYFSQKRSLNPTNKDKSDLKVLIEECITTSLKTGDYTVQEFGWNTKQAKGLSYETK